MPRSRPRSAAVLTVAVLGLAACGSTSTAHRSTSPPATTPAPAAPVSHTSPPATATPVPTPAPLSAPLMIQVENLYAARPQSGLSDADVVYEYDTEGGISRFSALWFHSPAASEKIGPVRSARLVNLGLLHDYGGALLYSGASNYTLAQLNSSGLKQYNPDSAATGSTVYRISSRAAPHNLYTDGSRLGSFEQRIGLGEVGYQLWKRTPLAGLPVGGTASASIQVPLSPSEQPIFSYDAAHGAYQRTEPGGGGYPATGILRDADTGSPWEVPTVVVLQVGVTTVAADNENSANYPVVPGLDFGIGPGTSGQGQLAVGGQLYGITWTQGPSGPPQLALANGQPAPVAPGQVLIELVSPGSTVTSR